MTSRPGGNNSLWVAFAIPAGVVLIPLVFAIILLLVRPEEGRRTAASRPPPTPLRTTPKPPQPPAPPAPVSPVPPPPASTPAVALVPTPASPSTVAVAVPPRQPSITQPLTRPVAAAPAAQATGTPIDLLASLDLSASAISGDWRRDGALLRCDKATSRARAKLRLVPPPPGGGYDFAITFTAKGERRFVAQVLSFRERQFIFAMFSSQSGFASVRGQNALANETTANKGISANQRHTSIVKVREHEVSAYLDGELLSRYTTDYSDLDVSQAWNLGPSSSRDSLLGLAVECPVTIESITLTPLKPLPASAPAPASFKDLAAMISGPYSPDSSAAATQPASRRRINPAQLASLVASSQPVISETAASLVAEIHDVAPGTTLPTTLAATQPDEQELQERDRLFQAVQLALAPAPAIADPLGEARSPDKPFAPPTRQEFDREQARLAAWRQLAGRMSEFYPDARSERDVIRIHLTPAGEGNAGRGPLHSFFLTHSEPDLLTNVTIGIEIVHALTSPAPTVVQYYFLSRWPAGQKLFLPNSFNPNISSRELAEFPGPAPANFLAGIIEVRAQLWSDQLSQPRQASTFDANFPPIARAQIDAAYRLVDAAVRRPSGSAPTAPPTTRASALIPGPIFPPRGEANEGSPELERASALARRALRLLAPQSSQSDEARDLMQQPVAALRDLRRRQVDAFVAALPIRSTRKGIWVIQKPGIFSRFLRPADREAALSAAGAGGGRVIMSVDSRMSDGSNVAVTLTAADQPDIRRKFTGRLHADASASGRLLLSLRSTQPPPARAPAPGDLKNIGYWTTLLLELRGNALLGVASAGPADSPTPLAVVFAAPAAPPTPPGQRPATNRAP